MTDATTTPEETAIRKFLAAPVRLQRADDFDDLLKGLSASQHITVCLAIGTEMALRRLPARSRSLQQCHDLLSEQQRDIVRRGQAGELGALPRSGKRQA